MCDVVELVAAQVRQRRPPPRDLEASRAEQQRVQPRDRVVLGRTVRTEIVEPASRLLVERRLLSAEIGCTIDSTVRR